MATPKRVECYINFLLPSNGKAAFWIRMFDRNHNQKLDPREQLLLGRFLAKKYLVGFTASLGGTQLKWSLREVRNSRLRGNPRQKKYAWDYRYSASIQAAKAGVYRLAFVFPLLFQNEMVPMAFGHMSSKQLLKTPTSYVLKKRGAVRAVCRIDRRRSRCIFAWKVGLSTTRRSATSLPAK